MFFSRLYPNSYKMLGQSEWAQKCRTQRMYSKWQEYRIFEVIFCCHWKNYKTVLICFEYIFETINWKQSNCFIFFEFGSDTVLSLSDQIGWHPKFIWNGFLADFNNQESVVIRFLCSSVEDSKTEWKAKDTQMKIHIKNAYKIKMGWKNGGETIF